MPRINLIIILATVLLSAMAQVCLKVGATAVDDQRISGLNSETFLHIFAVFRDPYVFLGMVMYALSAVSWVWVLSRVDISVAYPFVSLSFLITLGFGVWLFDEPVTAMKISGTFFIMLGCILITRS
jgi:drug/metabolite transporter (DMT)-like permease